MYDYIFWVEYRRNLDRHKSHWLSRNKAGGVVFIALLLHFLLVYELLHIWFGTKINFAFITTNKQFGILGALIGILVVYLYYNKKRIGQINRKRSKNGRPRKWER